MAKEYKVKTLKNGEKRYVFDVNLGYDASGKRIRTTVNAKTVKEGRKEVARLRLKEKIVVDNDALLFKDAYDQYLEDCKEKDAVTTFNNKEHAFRNRYFMFEETKLNKITDRDIIHWKKEVLSNYAVITRRMAEGNLNAFFNWCIKNKKINDNPFNYVDREKNTKRKNKINFWTEEEFKQFIEVVDDDMYKRLFTAFFYTGLRKGEMLGLKYKDINFENHEIHLNRSAKYVAGKTIINHDMKTSTSHRVVPFPRWLDLGSGEQEEFVFNPKIYGYLNEKFYFYQEKVEGLKKIRIHDLRHSYIAMLIHKGIDIYTIKEVAGHAKISTTLDTYGHLYPDKRKEITNLFD